MALTTASHRRVLITGVRGFIGCHLATQLAEVGHTVHGVLRPGHGGSPPGVIPHTVDLTNAESVSRLVREVRPEWTFHLSAHVTGDRRLDHADSLVLGNLAQTVHVATALAHEGCERLVIAGSMEEPGAGEPATATPSSPYAAAKWAGSAVARMYHALYKVPAVIARLSMVYGPGQRDTTKLVPFVITSLLRGESPALSSGSRPVDWIHVEDVVRGLEAAAASPGLEGLTVELGSGRLVTIREIVERIFALMGAPGTPRWGALADRPLERPVVADVEGARRLIGWTPQVALEQGLVDTIAWYRRMAAGHRAGSRARREIQALNRINTPDQLLERTVCNSAASADFDRFVLELIEPSESDVALDIGPGLGRQMIPLIGTVRRIVGLDASPEIIGALRARLASSSVEVVTGDMDDLGDLPLPGPFTLIYAVYSLYYSTRPSRVVEAAGRLLDGPRARFVVVAPDVGNNAAWFADLAQLYPVPADVLEVPHVCRNVILPAFLDTFRSVACATFWSTILFPTTDSVMRYYDACAPYCRPDRRADAVAYFGARVERDGGYRIVKRSLGLVGRL